MRRGLLWRKAPLVLRHFPGVMAALLVSAMILGLAGTMTPLLFSSAGSRASVERLREVSRWLAGFSTVGGGRFFGTTHGEPVWQVFERRDRAVRRAVAGIDQLEDRILTLSTADATAFASWPFGAVPRADPTVRPVGSPRRTSFVLAHRTHALEHLEKIVYEEEGRVQIAARDRKDFRMCALAGDIGPLDEGVWLSDTAAKSIGVCPGDEVEFQAGNLRARATVRGIYQNITTVFPGTFWDTLRDDAVAANTDPVLPPFILTDRTEFSRITEELREAGLFRWEFPVRGDGLTLPTARSLAEQLRGAARGFHIPPALADAPDFQLGGAQTLMSSVVTRADETVNATRGPLQFLSLGALAVALLVTATAGTYGAHRRRVEMTSLTAKGVTPLSLGAKGAFEAALPVIAGGLLGWAISLWLVRTLGPSPHITEEAIRESLAQLALALLVGLLLLGCLTSLAARNTGRPRSSRYLRVAALVPWDLLLLGLAWLSYVQLSNRNPSATEAHEVDVFMLLFPVLFIAGATGMAIRLLRLGLQNLRLAKRHGPIAAFLASRRLASASGIALLLLSITASSVGMFVYSASLVKSGEATVEAKALVFVGSDVSVPLQTAVDVPDLPFPSTIVRKIDGATLGSTLETVDVLGIDPSTFADAAFWDESFAGRPLDELVGELRGGSDPLPVIAVALDRLEKDALMTGGAEIPLAVTEHLDTFPGMLANRPLLIVDRSLLEARSTGDYQLSGRLELWAEGSPDVILETLNDERISLDGATTVDAVRRSASLLPLRWTFGLLQALGVAAGVITLVGILLYLQARQRARVIANAVMRRMGLAPSSGRAAVALELVGMLLIAFVIGAALAVLAAYLVYPYLDPLAGVPPGPLLKLPLGSIGVVGLLLLLASSLGGWSVQKAADRANVAQEMRLAH